VFILFVFLIRIGCSGTGYQYDQRRSGSTCSLKRKSCNGNGTHQNRAADHCGTFEVVGKRYAFVL